MKRTLVALITLTSICCCDWTSSASAAVKKSIYAGNGWKLTLTFAQMSYGETFHGSLTHGKKSYRTEGDWIPAADAGADLLRFYGQPFPNVKAQGLISVAILSNTCTPYCAASTTYTLAPISSWTLPGQSKAHPIQLKLQH
jgi:hypothetical protein